MKISKPRDKMGIITEECMISINAINGQRLNQV